MPRYRISFPMNLMFTVPGKNEDEALAEAKRVIGENFIDGADLSMHPFSKACEARLYFCETDEDGIESDEYPEPDD